MSTLQEELDKAAEKLAATMLANIRKREFATLFKGLSSASSASAAPAQNQALALDDLIAAKHRLSATRHPVGFVADAQTHGIIAKACGKALVERYGVLFAGVQLAIDPELPPRSKVDAYYDFAAYRERLATIARRQLERSRGK